MRQHAYHFVSHWHIAAPKTALETVLYRIDDWTTWWRGLQAVESDKRGIQPGSVFHATWRSASGYRLHLVLTITEHVAGKRISFTSAGDLVGKGSFTLHDEAGSTEITIDWQVRTTKPWMNLLAPLLRPLLVYNHNKLMAAGERGLAQYITELNL